MARVRDFPVVMKKVGFATFSKRVWQQISEDNVFTWGAALAYSWMFAIFPFLVFLLSLVPLIPDRYKPNPEDKNSDFVKVIEQALPQDAASIVLKQINNVLEKPSAGGFLSFGLILTLWASSGGMSMTMGALDKAYDIEKVRPYWKQRLIAIGLTAVVAVLLIATLVLLPIGSGVLHWISNRTSLIKSAWIIVAIDLARYAIGLLLMFGILALIYHYGPSFRHRFQAVTPGAVFCIAVWIGLGYGFRVYMQNFGGAASYNKMYGAVAGMVILLLLFYVDALVLLVGAEINSEIDFAVLGIASGDTPEQRAVAVTETAKEPDQQEFADELRDRRGSNQPPAQPQQPEQPVAAPAAQTAVPAAQTAAPAAQLAAPADHASVSHALYALAGVWLVSIISRRVRRPTMIARLDPRPTPQRLRETYPVTYELLGGGSDEPKNQTNGDGGRRL